MIPLWFLPFAIACGNTFILKPSERDPRPSELIFELIDSVDELPDGVLNLVHGAHDAVNGLLDHPEIDAISFVGQASTARYIAERSAATGKRFQALGGAKNSLDRDARRRPRRDRAGDHVLGLRRRRPALPRGLGGGARRHPLRAGPQRSTALAAAAADLGVGPGDQEGVEVCPLVGPEARDRIADAIEAAAAGDDEVVLDGRRDAGPGGTLIGPSIVETADTESDLAREELFGPLLAVVRAPDLDAALEFANGSRYGNAGSIFTTSGGAARAYRWGAEAGMLGVNVGVAAPVAWFPFSGWKDSIDGDLHANGTRRGRVLHAQEGRHLALVSRDAARGRRTRPGRPGSDAGRVLDRAGRRVRALADNRARRPARRPLASTASPGVDLDHPSGAADGLRDPGRTPAQLDCRRPRAVRSRHRRAPRRRCSPPATVRRRSSPSSTADAYGGSQFLDSTLHRALPGLPLRRGRSVSSTRAIRRRPIATAAGSTGKSSGGYGAMVVPMMRPDVFGAARLARRRAQFEVATRPTSARRASLRDELEGSSTSSSSAWPRPRRSSSTASSRSRSTVRRVLLAGSRAAGKALRRFEVETGRWSTTSGSAGSSSTRC